MGGIAPLKYQIWGWLIRALQISAFFLMELAIDQKLKILRMNRIGGNGLT